MIDKRITNQKMVILEAFRHLNHPTAEEVLNYIRRDFPDFSRATLYRNLAKYVEEGKLVKVFLTGETRYETLTSKHLHLVCKSCGRIENVNFDYPITQPKNLMGFKLTGYDLSFTGYCPDCID